MNNKERKRLYAKWTKETDDILNKETNGQFRVKAYFGWTESFGVRLKDNKITVKKNDK